MTQAQSPRFGMLHKILPPQPLDLRNSGEITENWKFWKAKYTTLSSRDYKKNTNAILVRNARKPLFTVTRVKTTTRE